MLCDDLQWWNRAGAKEAQEGGRGRKQISQDGKLGSLAPRFVNTGDVTAESIYSTVLAGHEGPA